MRVKATTNVLLGLLPEGESKDYYQHQPPAPRHGGEAQEHPIAVVSVYNARLGFSVASVKLFKLGTSRFPTGYEPT